MMVREFFNQEQVDYLRVVLGVEDFIWPELPTSPKEFFADFKIEGNLASAKLMAILPLNGKAIAPEAERELFGKMLQAIKLGAADVAIMYFDLQDREQTEGVSRFVFAAVSSNPNLIPVLFDSQAALPVFAVSFLPGEQHPLGPTSVLLTYSPSELINNSDLKRPAWAHLQNLMRYWK